MLSWENTTFEIAAAGVDLALLPVGAIEQHSYHLPIGTDWLSVQAVARLAAERLNALLLPALPYGNSQEHQGFIGTIWLRPETLARAVTDIVDALVHHGIRRIVIVNGHGGNRYILPQLIFECLNRRKDYALYLARVQNDPALRQRLLETHYHAHACECETSIVMHLRGDLVEAEKIGMLDGTPQRDFDIGDVYSSVDWYSLHPTNYAGDARTSSPEKGKALFEDRARRLADIIARIKQDQRVPELLAEFYGRCEDFRGAAST